MLMLILLIGMVLMFGSLGSLILKIMYEILSSAQSWNVSFHITWYKNQG